MWRACFMAIGVSLCILGGECLIFEKAVLHSQQQDAASSMVGMPYLSAVSTESGSSEVKFPDWAPWTLISAGTVVVCYSLTVAKT
jgi:hypothetical protein